MGFVIITNLYCIHFLKPPPNMLRVLVVWWNAQMNCLGNF